MVKISKTDTSIEQPEQTKCIDFLVAFFTRDTETVMSCLNDDVVTEVLGRGTIKGKPEFDESYQQALDIRAAEIVFDHVFSSTESVSADGKLLTDDDRWLSFMFVGEYVSDSMDSKFHHMKLCIVPTED